MALGCPLGVGAQAWPLGVAVGVHLLHILDLIELVAQPIFYVGNSRSIKTAAYFTARLGTRLGRKARWQMGLPPPAFAVLSPFAFRLLQYLHMGGGTAGGMWLLAE